MEAKYQQKAGIREQKMGEETMLMDEETDRVHVLNPSASFIWSQLATASSTPDVENALRGAYDVSEVDDLRDLVRTTLDSFAEKELVVLS